MLTAVERTQELKSSLLEQIRVNGMIVRGINNETRTPDTVQAVDLKYSNARIKNAEGLLSACNKYLDIAENIASAEVEA